MIICSILYSPNLDSYYIGMSQEKIADRILKHNTSFYGVHYTSKTSDWELYYIIECVTISQAMKIEKHIKKMKSIIYLKNLKKFETIQLKLLEKYK